MERRVWRWSQVKPPLLPVRDWLPHYKRRWLRSDLIAAAAVWAVLVPEGMAYASLAGLPPETGLFAAMAPLLAYAVLGTCRQITVGPSSALAAYSAAAVAPLATGDGGRFIALSALLALLVGGLLLIAGVVRAGFVADFFARPVLTGFVAGLALVIGGTTFFGKLEVLLRQLGSANLATLAIGLAALAVIFALRAYAPRAPSALIAVVLGIVAVGVLDLQGHGVQVVGEIPDGLPGLVIPSFAISDVTDLLPDAAALALIAFAESVAGARAFAAKHGYEVDADQELVALGVSNLGAGLLQGFSVDASLSRSAVAASSGVKTQLSGILLLCLLVVTRLVLMPLFHDLPEAVLGAIVIGAVAHLVDVGALRRLWRIDRTDSLLALLCLAGVLLFGILIGLAVAVVVSLLALVYRAYRPTTPCLDRSRARRRETSLPWSDITPNARPSRVS
jgi:high affinity sulfate transporter 1